MTYDTINDAVTKQGGEGTLLAGRYRVVRQLGQGGMGSVWLAEDTQLDNKQFAIKMLPSILVSNKRAYRQLKDEALVAMKLTHPNIVTLRAFEENNGNPFLVMDYIDGETLDTCLAQWGVLDSVEAVAILKPIASALDYAHSKGVVHRDVKPGNVMVARDGTPYILDFGIAREIQETMTRVTGKLSSGTLLYMSPEQLNGEPPKPAQDVYSFAAMAYECLKGEPPFSRGNIEFQIVNKVPDPPVGRNAPATAESAGRGVLDAPLVVGIMAGLAKNPLSRPETCLAVLGRFVQRLRIDNDSSRGIGDNALSASQMGRGSVVKGIRMMIAAVMAIVVVGALAVYVVLPRVYEATSEFTIDMRRSSISRGGALSETTPDYGSTYVEIFNTRISDWKSEKVFAKTVQRYRTGNPNSMVSDEELIGTLTGSKLNLVRNSRIITITVYSKTPVVCAALANAYAEAIEAFTDEENKRRCDKAVAQIHANVEKRRHEVDEIAKKLLNFRSAKNVDSLRSKRETISAGLSKTTGDILALETEETQLVEWEKMLEAVQKDPASYGNLSTGVPRAQEIAQEFRAYQDADKNYQKQLFAFTEDHPDVVNAKKAQELCRQRFLDVTARALLTGRSALRVVRNRLENLRKKQEDLGKDLASVEQQIVLAESGLGQLEAEFNVANRVMEGLIMDENKARMEAESNNEIVRVGRPAGIPSRPVRQNMGLIFGILGAILVLLGISFATCQFCIRTHVGNE